MTSYRVIRAALRLRIVSVCAAAAIVLVGCSSDRKTTAPDTNHVAGANCQSCHTTEHQNWSVSLHAADPSAVLLNATHDGEELLTDECIGCHSPFQAGQYHIGDFVQPVDQTGPWHLVAANTDKWQAIKCEACHDPTSTQPYKLAFYDSGTRRYVTVANTTELCEKCHQAGTDDSRDLAGSVHDGKQCGDCHLRPGTHMSLDPRGSCGRCHPAVGPAGHPDVTTLDTTYQSPESAHNIHFVKCSDCHAGTPAPMQSGAARVM